MTTVIESTEAAARLGAEILDPARTAPLVGVSMAAGRSAPLVDMETLRARLSGRATVHLVATGEATWELKRLLPQGLDLFGDALRVWQPGVQAGVGADHKLLILHEGGDPGATAEQARDIVDRGTHRERAAIVSKVSREQATLRLTDGGEVVVPLSEITRHGLSADHVLRPAQAVRVLILADSVGGAPARGSLLPFEPDPRRRFADAYAVGSVVLVRVDRLHHFGAFVELLPGLVGLVRVGRIAEQWVSHPADELAVGAILAARVLDLSGEHIELSLRSVIGSVDVLAASLYADGPPWFSPPSPVTELPELQEHQAAVNAWEIAGRPHGRLGPDELEGLSELERLDDLILRSGEIHERSRRLMGDAGRSMARLRAEAGGLRHELETDLINLRERVLRTIEDETQSIQGSTQEALDVARTEIRRLQALLAKSRRAHEELEQHVRSTSEQSRRSGESLRKMSAEADRQRARARALQEELDNFLPAQDRLRAAIRSSWVRHTTKADRELHRWREPLIGPSFLNSLELLEGVSRDRVIDVCAEVISGRAIDRSGLQVHPLRSTQAGGSPQQMRADGARAYRASLQVRSSAARRLHYWELPDGSIELAKVGYHDDFTID